MVKLPINRQQLTKEQFESLLRKAAQPISEWKHVPKGTKTTAVRPSDGCSGKRKSQGKTGDVKDSQSD